MKSKRERFVSIASARTTRILNDMRLLSNCANTRNYDYTKEDAEKILRAIDEGVRELKIAFHSKKKKSHIEFKLEEKK